jgi:hypothetical protein
MKFKNLFLIASLLSLGFLSSCDQDDEPEVENMSTYPISGDWSVNHYVADADGKLEDIGYPGQILAYNTAANNGTEIWIDDHKTFWNYKVRATVNMGATSFSGTEMQNVSYNSKVTITEGKVIPNGTKVHGIPADSIVFKVSFSDDGTAANPDPYGTIYIVGGHRNTGFEH